METLTTIWFLLVFVLIAGYAILDGFDLGVGALHLFGRSDTERRVQLNAIGPVWDGNEVWLLTGGGALFAAFPIVYATVFSAFYLALMLLLVALIARAVSMEFRSKVESPAWRNAWDIAFSLGSILPAVLFGVAFGNILRGIPLDETKTFTGSFFGLLNPYAVLIGLLSLTLFTLHGALYLAVKTEGALQVLVARYLSPLWIACMVLYCLATAATLLVSPFLFTGLLHNPLFYLFLALTVAGLLSIPFAAHARRHVTAFLSSSASIAGMVGLSALSLFPRLVPSTHDLSYSLTTANSSSSQRTLTVMLIIALIGVPLVLLYTAFIYRCFRGKVLVTPEGY